MLYKFKSKATGDLVMLQPHGDMLLRIIGKEPAEKGIVLVADMPRALSALQQAIERQESQQTDDPTAEGDAPEGVDVITLRQRAVPFMDMLRRCMAHPCDVVWGV